MSDTELESFQVRIREAKRIIQDRVLEATSASTAGIRAALELLQEAPEVVDVRPLRGIDDDHVVLSVSTASRAVVVHVRRVDLGR